jgi:hypothetical protein
VGFSEVGSGCQNVSRCRGHQNAEPISKYPFYCLESHSMMTLSISELAKITLLKYDCQKHPLMFAVLDASISACMECGLANEASLPSLAGQLLSSSTGILKFLSHMVFLDS